MIHFTVNGKITLNKLAAQSMQLVDGDCIEFLQDLNSQKDWFVAKSTAGIGFRLSSSRSKSGGLGVSSKELFRQVARSLGLSKSFRCPVCPSPTDEGHWPIITHGAN